MSGLLYPCNVQGMASLLLAEEKLTLLPFPGGKDIIYTISKMLVVQHSHVLRGLSQHYFSPRPITFRAAFTDYKDFYACIHYVIVDKPLFSSAELLSLI